MQKLLTCIEEIRARLDGLRRRGLKVTPTRLIIIDRLLQARGGDIHDFEAEGAVPAGRGKLP